MDVGADAVADAADRHDPRAGDRQQPVQQQAGEGEVAQVVGAELQLEAVLGGRLRRVHHAGVVDQQVDAVVVGAQLLRGGADDSSEVRSSSCSATSAPGAAGGDAGGGVLALVEVAHGEHHVGAVRGEGLGGLEAQAGVGAGDDGDAPGLVGNVGGWSTWPWKAPRLVR